jgi:hypothetical protein
MNRSYKIVIIVLSLFNFALSQNQPDSLRIFREGVYFFGPSQSELDSAKEDYMEAYSDFSYYTGRVVPVVREMGFEPEYFSQKIIVIEYTTQVIVNRDSVDFGTILYDGKKKPLVLKYVLTDEELKENIFYYFKKEYTRPVICSSVNYIILLNQLFWCLFGPAGIPVCGLFILIDSSHLNKRILICVLYKKSRDMV